MATVKASSSSSSWTNSKLFLIINLGGLMIHMVMMNRYLMQTLNPTIPKRHYHKPKKQQKERSYSEGRKALQDEFQKLLHRQQLQQGNNRILYVEPSDAMLPGFCLEFRTMARYLQIAAATNRKFIIHPDWKSGYELHTNDTNNNDCRSWNCFWRQPSTTKSKQTTRRNKKLNTKKTTTNNNNNNNSTTGTDSKSLLDDSYQSYGIIPEAPDSGFFNVRYYGSDPYVLAPPYPWDRNELMDVIPHWERRMGRYWIRSQMVHYLWSHPTKALQEEKAKRMPTIDEPYIGFHIRYSDNIGHLDRDFARNAHTTRNFSHYMDIAETIRKRSHEKISTIYLATDNEEMIAASQRVNNGWKFVLLNGPVPRISLQERTEDVELEWFVDRANQRDVGGIVADLELLRRADYLVGSFQSNVYRMAAELNSAYHPDRDDDDVVTKTNNNHIYAVDIEWYEDP